MDEECLFEQLGLNKHESKIYLVLLRFGEASAVTIAKETSLHRRTVYDELEKLKKKGLVNLKIKKFVQYFAPSSPEKFKEILEEKQILLNSSLPKLLQQFKNTEKKVSLHIFEGVEGMKAVLNDALKECTKNKDELLMFGAGLKTPQYLKYSFPHYAKYLEKVKWRLIEPDIKDIRNEISTWEKSFMNNCRFLPENYLSPVGILVYTNRTIIMLLEGEPVIIQIIGSKYSKAFRTYFEILWNVAK
ncbi:hypothetical protein HZA97_04080 [Candidatus Woesearchaeota archaeon]|nr:hypothetical protein [Candidatus Woesearchaeota archaeon]